MKKLLIPLLLATLCSCNPTVTPSSSSNINQSTNNNSSTNKVSENKGSSSSSTTTYLQLDEVKNNAIVILTNEFNKYDIDDYSIKNWNKM